MANSATYTPKFTLLNDPRTEVVTLGVWVASTAYLVGQIVRSGSGSGDYYQCTTAGTSGSSAPTWTTTGATVTDNTVTWRDIGAGNPGDLVLRPNGYVGFIAGLTPLIVERTVTFQYYGIGTVAKAAGTSFSDGQDVYFNTATNLAVTAAPAQGFFLGIARGSSLTGATTQQVWLNGAGLVSTTSTLSFTGASGANIISVPSAAADAFDIKDGVPNTYFQIVSSTGSVNISGANTGGTSAGGAIVVTAGAGGTTSGTGGAVTLTAGAGAGGTATGGASSLVAGAGYSSGTGGAANLTAGAGGATGTGGQTNVTSGAGGSTSGASGQVVIGSGSVTATSGSASGAVTVQTAAGATCSTATAGASGAMTIQTGAGGAATGSYAGGAGGTISILGGAGGATSTTNTGGAGSSIVVTAGAGGAPAGAGTSGAGGAVTITAGAAGVGSATTGAAGGAANLIGGAGSVAAAGGAAVLTGGAGGATGAGGAITITSGAGGSTSGAPGAINIAVGSCTSGIGAAITITGGNGAGGTNGGGNINLVPGTAVSTGTPGEVQVNGAAGLFDAQWSQYLAASVPVSGTSYTFFMANRAYRIKAVSVICSSTSTTPTVDVTIDTGTTAPGGGTSCMTGAITFSGTANTRVTGTLSSTVANCTMAAGNRLACKWGGTVGSITGAQISVTLVPC
jgi:hypothetical protein